LNGQEEAVCQVSPISLSRFAVYGLQTLSMRQQNPFSNASAGQGNPPVSSIPFIQPSLSTVPGETIGRVLDLEIWDLDLQGSFARNSLPKISLLPVTFSWFDATRSGTDDEI